MINYKGLYNGKNKKVEFYEGGAHFKYSDLYERVNELQKIISPNRLKVESSNLDKDNIERVEIKKISKKYNIKKPNKINLDELLQSDNKNNIFMIKKNKLSKNIFLNKKKADDININNILNNDKKNNDDIDEINNININIKEKNFKDELIIKLKLKKLSNLKKLKSSRIKKFFNFKKNKQNSSLPKINSFYFKNLSKDINDENKNNNFSDIIDNGNTSNINKNNFSNLCLSSNNLMENKELSNSNSNSNYKKDNNIFDIKHFFMKENKKHFFESRNYDLPFANKFSIDKTINHNNSNSSLFIKIKKINSNTINKENNNLKESLIEKKKNINLLKNKDLINIYSKNIMKNIDFKSQNAIIKGNNENKSNIIKIKIQ